MQGIVARLKTPTIFIIHVYPNTFIGGATEMFAHTVVSRGKVTRNCNAGAFENMHY